MVTQFHTIPHNFTPFHTLDLRYHPNLQRGQGLLTVSLASPQRDQQDYHYGDQGRS